MNSTRNRVSCYPGATRTKNKNGLPEGKPLFCLVGRAGLEPATNGLKVRCSTN